MYVAGHSMQERLSYLCPDGRHHLYVHGWADFCQFGLHPSCGGQMFRKRFLSDAVLESCMSSSWKDTGILIILLICVIRYYKI